MTPASRDWQPIRRASAQFTKYVHSKESVCQATIRF